jgi:hypothetical protein
MFAMLFDIMGALGTDEAKMEPLHKIYQRIVDLWSVCSPKGTAAKRRTGKQREYDWLPHVVQTVFGNTFLKICGYGWLSAAFRYLALSVMPSMISFPPSMHMVLIMQRADKECI